EKGIGRFAASRLANNLEVVTRRAGEDREIRALFDWSQFDDEQKYLDQDEASPQQAAGYQEENLLMMRNHGFSNSSLGFDHGVGHPLLHLCNAKAPNYGKNKAFKILGHYAE